FCSLQVAVGGCEHKWPHYYFDKEKGACIMFFYSGCGGNSNRSTKLFDPCTYSFSPEAWYFIKWYCSFNREEYVRASSAQHPTMLRTVSSRAYKRQPNGRESVVKAAKAIITIARNPTDKPHLVAGTVGHHQCSFLGFIAVWLVGPTNTVLAHALFDNSSPNNLLTTVVAKWLAIEEESTHVEVSPVNGPRIKDTMTAKQLWEKKCGWKKLIDTALKVLCECSQHYIKVVDPLEMPRCIMIIGVVRYNDLRTFFDASEVGRESVVYLRFIRRSWRLPSRPFEGGAKLVILPGCKEQRGLVRTTDNPISQYVRASQAELGTKKYLWRLPPPVCSMEAPVVWRFMLSIYFMRFLAEYKSDRSYVGPCKGHMPQVFFNRTSGACEDFIYGGCAGNANRFGTVAECELACLV
ncbi:kunitz-type serine protease inhibitor 6, partial [Clonorchis sinensis]